MRKIGYFLLCIFFVFGYSYHVSAQADRPPVFTGGSIQSLMVCESSGTTPINALLAVQDSDIGQTETWSIFMAPTHGSLIAGYTTTSTGGVLTPTGLTYAPNVGYGGNDSFIVKVSDGTTISITTIYVAVNPALITGPSGVCTGSTITLTDGAIGGLWSSSGTAASVTIGSGVVTGMTAGLVNITYTLGTCTTTKAISVNPIAAITGGTTVICAGTTLSLSDPVPGGAWVSDDAGIATVATDGIVTGTSGGTTTITYTTGAGCVATKAVTINPAPSPIAGTASVCAGSTTSLSDLAGGGTWSVSPAGVATISGSGTVGGVAAGITTVTYSFSSGCKMTRAVTVYATPATITGTANVCAGLTTSFFNTVSSGTWSSSNTAIATVNASSGLILGENAGTATITYTLGGGCMATKGVTVNVSPSPITGLSSVCVGSSITLADVTGGGSWSSTGSFVSIGSGSGLITGLLPGTPTITYAIGSCVATKVVTVNPISPITGAGTICAGSALTLSDAVSGGTWTSDDDGIATVGTGGIVTGASGGTVIISYTMGSGCIVTTTVTINPLPAAIAGAANVCAGATTSLTDITGGGSWASTSALVATTGSTGVVSGISAGLVVVTYTLPTGCKTMRTVTVNPSPGTITGTAVVCAGLTTTLINAVAGGAWSSSNDTISMVSISSGVVTGVSAGIAIMTYQLPGGCFATAPVTVNVTPAPITGPSSVCTGFTITLNDTTAGGTWSNSSVIATIDASTGVAGGISLGTSIITYKIGSCIATRILTVNPISPITNGSTICLGTMKTLLDATEFGIWSSSDTDIATVGTLGFGEGLVTAVSTGVVTISYTLGSCMVSNSLTVNPLPGAIGGTEAVCQGFTATLTDTTSGGTWSSTTRSIATVDITTGMVSGVSAGTSVITYVLATGCLRTAAFTVNQLPIPIVENYPICVGVTNYLDNVVGGTWSSSNTAVAIINETSGAITCLSVGTTVATFTLPTGCSTSDTLNIKLCDDAVSQVAAQNNDITISPNPDNGEFTINGNMGTNGEVSIAILNVQGQAIYRKSAATQNGQINERVQLDASIANGLYILNLHGANGSKIFRIVVQR